MGSSGGHNRFGSWAAAGAAGGETGGAVSGAGVVRRALAYTRTERARQIACYGIPLLLVLGFYWPGLTNWFYQDDFGWLNLRRDVHSWRDLGTALFAPKAHGNIRTLGENAYFLILSTLFGVNPLPFRVVAFLTEMASLTLLGAIVYRLIGSRLAGLSAQILWIINCALAPVMCWTSIYNQALSAFFFLLAFYLLLRHVETGENRFYIAQWAAFILGLGALETNVVYPAVAAWYAVLFARGLLKKILPMFLVSVGFTAAHLMAAPPERAGVYSLHLDGSMLSTLWTYWTWALGAARLSSITAMPTWLVLIVNTVLTGSCLAFVVWKWRKGERLGLLAVGWFAIVLGPYLPLRDHMADYYLAVPVVGLAMLEGWAIACASRAAGPWKIAALLCIGTYCATSVPAAWAITRWHHERAMKVENLVLGVAEAHAAHPAKIILLEGVTSDLFWSAIVDVPFRVMEIPHVYLVPGSEARIEAAPDLVSKFVLPEEIAARALKEDRAVVYESGGPVLRNITARYRAIAKALWKPEAPRFINIGDPVFAGYLGQGWGEAGDGYRYMRGTGSIRMGGPHGANEHLYIGIFERNDFGLRVRVDGVEAPVELIRRNYEISEFKVNLPSSVIGKGIIEVLLSTDSENVSAAGRGPAPRPPRDYLKFGYVEIR